MRFRKIFPAVFAAAFAGGLLFFPAAAAQGAARGLEYCLVILVPSLFPFMVLSTYLVKSGISESLGRFLGPATRFLFHLPGCSAATIFMSMIGGFPVGARGIAALYEEGSINDREAGRMLSFCVNAGPAFVISVVGLGLLGSVEAGAILLTAQLLAALLLGVFLGAAAKSGGSPPQRPKRKTSASPFINSTIDAAKGTMNMCAFVILFSVLISLLRETGAAIVLGRFLLRLGFPPAVCGASLSVLLEVTGGCFDIAALGGSAALYAFAMGWGGLCVHFQVLSCLTKIEFSRPRFFLHQFLQGVASALIAAILFQIFPESVQAFSNTSSPLSPKLSGNAAAAAALILLCVALLFSVGGEKLEFRKKKCYNRNHIKNTTA